MAPQRLFDIAKIYGGQLADVPTKPVKRHTASASKATKPASPVRAQHSARNVDSPAKGAPPAALGSTAMALEQERLEILRRKVQRRCSPQRTLGHFAWS